MPATKFVADVMVGKLARWLRILGFDVLYNNRFEDDEILRTAEDQDRVILTRDAELHKRGGARSLFIEADDYEEQVQQVLSAFQLKDAVSLFTRCAECNALLVETDREAVFLKAPPYVYLTQKDFAICPACDRVYWRGSHADGIAAKMKRWTS
jgi:uncharacterized protein